MMRDGCSLELTLGAAGLGAAGLGSGFFSGSSLERSKVQLAAACLLQHMPSAQSMPAFFSSFLGCGLGAALIGALETGLAGCWYLERDIYLGSGLAGYLL